VIEYEADVEMMTKFTVDDYGAGCVKCTAVNVPEGVATVGDTYRVRLERVEPLNPCPYCEDGGDPYDVEGLGPWYYIVCLDCGARGPGASERSEAMRLWNSA